MRRHFVLSPESEATIRECWPDTARLSEALGVSGPTANRYGRLLGLTPRPPGRPRGPRDPARTVEILAALESGEAAAIVGRRFGINANRVGAIAKNAGCPLASMVGRSAIRHRGPRDPDRIVAIRSALERGETTTTVAAQFGVTQGDISNLAKKYGFPIRAIRARQAASA